MTAIWPLVTRELREQSRQPMSYWLRVFAVGSLLLALGLFLRFSSADLPLNNQIGALLFGRLNGILALVAGLAPPRFRNGGHARISWRSYSRRLGCIFS
jgi:hypothetical protein